MTITVRPDEPGLWHRHSAQFGSMGAPLRPSAEDVAVVRRVVGERAMGGVVPRVLVLGVTPEFRGMGGRVLALDRNADMIRGVWPGYREGAADYACADWLRLPLADRSHDVVCCDGGTTLLAFPHGLDHLAREVARVLADHGRFVLRAFLRPEQPEAVDAVLAALAEGSIGSFHAFKWRLAMALQTDAEVGVPVQRVWDVWDAEGRAVYRGGPIRWSVDVVRTIEAYRGLSTSLHFPSLAELRARLSEAFEVEGVLVPSYELGERCPTLTLRPPS